MVLGSTEARLAGEPVDLGTPKQRALLCALALSSPRPVAVDTIVELLWGDEPPGAVTTTLQAYVSGLRRVLEPARERRRPAEVLVTVAPGYALRLPAEAVDAGRFTALVATQHRLLAGVPLFGANGLGRGTLTEAVARLDEALALWRGQPYGELADASDAVAERARLEDLRLVALEDRAVAGLALGQHATVAAELEALTVAHPLRERLWGLRAVALTRAGRQADALEALSTIREVLAEELGLEPGIELRSLQTAVLRQEPELAWVVPAADAPAQAPSAAALPTPLVITPTPVPMPSAPMVGRESELSTLTGLLDAAEAGTASYVALVGEPGIGKSRLAAEAGRLARDRGWTVAVGRCPQDEGAPPLWPWNAVLADLGGALPEVTAESGDAGARFRVWEEIAGQVRARTFAGPVLLVMEDLHWACSASLGALRVLSESMSDERLLVLTTRRAHPEPSGPLADLGEAAARRHGLRIDLDGLGQQDAATVAEQVTGIRPTRSESEALRARTEGNPFFVIEFARLAGRSGDLGQLLGEENPPTAVQEVLGRRIERLPTETVAALRTAAVMGRQFDLTTLARAAEIDEDDLLDTVEPAQAAGLVGEDGIDRFAFAHALVVDTLLAGLRPSRRSRVHAKVAEALAAGDAQETELARHWLAAGPAYGAKAWRSAVAAARQSSKLHDHDRARLLLMEALDRLALDQTATPRDRYDLLIQLIDAHRWAAMWPDLVACVEEAVAIARELGDVELMAQAAISTNLGALWQSAPYGEVHSGVVAALKEALERLPRGDSVLRCRVLLGLANETYYVAGFDERKAISLEALAMAERLGDRRLLLEAHQGIGMALWCLCNTQERLGHAEAALALARELGDERAALVSACQRCVALNEIGRPDEMFAAIAEARAEAERLRIPYGLIVLDGVELSWLALAGRFEECEAIMESIDRLDAQMSLEHSGDAKATAMLSMLRWQNKDADLAEVLAELDDSPFPIASTRTCALWRSGDEDGARAYAAEHPAEFDHDDWFSEFAFAHTAEQALYLGDTDLARRVLAVLAPYAGESVTGGSVLACGPVDLYLALAAAAAGGTEEAGRHADRALELCAQWQIPLVADWLVGLRESYAF